MSTDATTLQNSSEDIKFASQALQSLVSAAYLPMVRGEDATAMQELHEQLDNDGCSVLKGFLNPEIAGRIQDQAASVEDKGYFQTVYTNPYSTADDESFPEGHPRRTFLERTQGFVANDLIPADHIVQTLYQNDIFRDFVRRCVREDEIHEYADPFGKLVYNVCRTGATHPWHFDTNEFIVSMLAKPCQGGGLFEYCPNIRTSGEENYDAVQAVIQNRDRSPVKTIELKTGDLQIFHGRFSLHRVTPVEGDEARITAIFAYSKEPGFVSQAHRARKLFGRVHAVHEQAGKVKRKDGLAD